MTSTAASAPRPVQAYDPFAGLRRDMEVIVTRSVSNAIEDQEERLQQIIQRAIAGQERQLSNALGDALDGAADDLELRFRTAARDLVEEQKVDLRQEVDSIVANLRGELRGELDEVVDEVAGQARSIIQEETSSFETRITQLVDERLTLEKQKLADASKPVADRALRFGALGAATGLVGMGLLTLGARNAPLAAKASWMMAGTSFAGMAGGAYGIASATAIR